MTLCGLLSSVNARDTRLEAILLPVVGEDWRYPVAIYFFGLDTKDKKA